MNRDDWDLWRASKTPAIKGKLFTKMLADNEPLARSFAASYIRQTQYYTENLQDDLLQAARIGLIRAIEGWKPEKGSFSLCAYFWTRHEMQLVVRHATGVSVPKSAFLPRTKQDEIAKFWALHGREPTPEEVGLTESAVDRFRKATPIFVAPHEADDLATPAASVDHSAQDAEDNIDRKRDQESLRVFVGKLSARDRKAFWRGDRPDLTERARVFVEGRRGCRK